MKDYRKKILDTLQYQLELCERFLYEKARLNPQFRETVEMLEKDLPLHINDTGLMGEMVQARLKGEKVDTAEYQTKAMYDLEFSVEDYKAVGFNDGALSVINRVALDLGDSAMAERALAAQYSAD
jgi:2-hydroxy-3-keto-5-methylthiopentenyl-1-phosphate phosphatase